MNDSENLLIHTEEPLIPLLPSDNTSYIQLLPPYDIDNENDMRFNVRVFQGMFEEIGLFSLCICGDCLWRQIM